MDTNASSRVHALYQFAGKWQERADAERGKTVDNGWTSREVVNAENRRHDCERMRDACMAEITRLLDLN